MLRALIGLGTNYEKAIVLNGTNQHAISSSADFSITGNLTMGAWIKLTSIGQAGAIIMGNSSYYMEIGSGGSRPSFTIAGQYNANPIKYASLADLAWHHVAISYDGTNIYIYQDGALLGQESHPNNPTAQTDFTIGSKADLSAHTACSMKYAFVCAQALSSSQVHDAYALGPIDRYLNSYLSSLSLKGLWSFNNIYTDLSARGNTLTAANTPTFSNVSGTDFGRGTRTAI